VVEATSSELAARHSARPGDVYGNGDGSKGGDLQLARLVHFSSSSRPRTIERLAYHLPFFLPCSMIHYPSTSSEQPQPAQPSPTVPVMPAHPLPSSPSTETGDLQVNFLPASHGSSPHYDLVSQKLSTKLKTIIGIGANSSSSAPHEVGGVLIDPLKCRKSPEVQSAAARFTTSQFLSLTVHLSRESS
jgi:hypothetical protein